MRLRVGVLRRNDLRHHNGGLRPRSHNLVDEAAEPGVRRLPAVGVAVVGASVQEHDVGLDTSLRDGSDRVGDLVDGPAGVAFVVLVGHGAALHGSDIVDRCSRALEGREEELAVAVAGRAADSILRVAKSEPCAMEAFTGFVYRNAISQRKDAQVLPFERSLTFFKGGRSCEHRNCATECDKALEETHFATPYDCRE